MALLFSQTLALTHAYEHDPGKLQSLACTTCIATQNASSGCIDSAAGIDFTAGRPALLAGEPGTPETLQMPSARQRSPPTHI